ncbi:VOC family protein [Paenibacillus sp. S-38]|uniref:VOC family protein n=1 Tax=Paenibacillus sp. S-38 TaxID=3416710 RepID=UPI003CF97B13
MEKVKARIEHSLTVLLVSDLQRSMKYYEEALGCEVNEHWAVRDEFGPGFNLIQAADPGDVRPNKGTWNTYAYVKAHEELDLLSEEFQANGAYIATGPNVTEHEWGAWKDFAVQDPDGYLIGFGSGSRNG